MSHIDDDLKKTLEEAGAPPVTVPGQPEPLQRKKGQGRNIGLLIALSLMALSILALVTFSFKDAAVYAKPVDQLMQSSDRMVGRRVRVEGTLVRGSLMRRDDPCEYKFRMHRNGAELEVRYPNCVVPDTFRDRPEADVDVTAEGVLLADKTFEASQIMAKCPSKYEEQAGKKPAGKQSSL